MKRVIMDNWPQQGERLMIATSVHDTDNYYYRPGEIDGQRCIIQKHQQRDGSFEEWYGLLKWSVGSSGSALTSK